MSNSDQLAAVFVIVFILFALIATFGGGSDNSMSGDKYGNHPEYYDNYPR